MAGPSLEVFKFGLYLFFPLAIMVHYGDPEWYHKHVLPVRDSFWPREETLYQPPRTSEGVKAALEEYRQKRIERKEARAEAEGSAGPTKARAVRASLPVAGQQPSSAQGSQRPHDVQGTVPIWAATSSRRLV